MKLSKALTLYCPHVSGMCLGPKCLFWTWTDSADDGAHTPDSLGDCSMTTRNHNSIWRTFANEDSAA